MASYIVNLTESIDKLKQICQPYTIPGVEEMYDPQLLDHLGIPEWIFFENLHQNQTPSDPNSTTTDNNGAIHIEPSTLDQIYNAYHPIHKWLIVGTALIGIVANSLNISVLTRKKMRTKMNAFLTAIAIADLATVTMALIYTVHFDIRQHNCASRRLTETWMIYNRVYSYVTVTTRAISLWLTAIMAGLRWRILNKRYIYQNQADRRTILQIFFVMIPIIFLTFPTYLEQKTETVTFCNIIPDCPKKIYWNVESDLLQSDNFLFRKISYWINGIVLKALPCFLLLIFILGLVACLQRAEARRRRLSLQIGNDPSGTQACNAYIHDPTTNGTGGGGNAVTSLCVSVNCYLAHRTTIILILILVITFICELPHATISIIVGIDASFESAYHNLGDFLDLLALINFTLIFFAYIAMSSDYRLTLRQILTQHRQHLNTVYENSRAKRLFSLLPSQNTATANRNSNRPRLNGRESQDDEEDEEHEGMLTSPPRRALDRLDTNVSIPMIDVEHQSSL